ncbi:MAG: 4-hydroxy-tetrahydrodipicolinate reductase [Weeksellaceae bacterium]|nr:4-hydroxy-tetrahydrodipicolinate reductase [Weeksellaceae bacterium]
MKIAIIGYGKMGRAVEQLATRAGHQVVLRVNETPTHAQLMDSKTQVAIEFSKPEVAHRNIVALLRSNIPVVSGTTGWLDHMQDVIERVEMYNGTFLYASNFSLGVNLYLEIIQQAARIMKDQSLYDLKIEEIHHTQKKDAPSGTAISMAQRIFLESSYEFWVSGATTQKNRTIPIQSKREEDIPGTHLLTYGSEIDSIEIKHTAYSREGFALGALRAAEYIYGKRGIFTMRDVLGF